MRSAGGFIRFSLGIAMYVPHDAVGSVAALLGDPRRDYSAVELRNRFHGFPGWGSEDQ